MSGLDQFYTKPEIAKACWKSLAPITRKLTGAPRSKLFFIEPSAGDGVFYNLLPQDRRMGMDIDPCAAGIMKRDFLKYRYQAPVSSEMAVIVGNPPFGKRGRLAVNFVNKAFTIADTIAFIVPVIFKKHFIHKQIEATAKLVYAQPLERNAFRTLTKANYPVNTEFQVWTRLDGYRDLRLFTAPPTAHPDFIMHQYNNTLEARKMFKKPFDFAVPCQGWQDYSRRVRRASDCEMHKQWILFKASGRVLERLLNLNFADLAMKYTTSTPGFRKGDVVQEYIEYMDCHG